MSTKTELMDVTLRDGSYAINFQFSEYETEKIGRELDKAGVQYIEVGHGMGLNASSAKNGTAFCTDEEYLKAAQLGITNAKYGMFCIPGISEVEDLDKLVQFGASFVRIGTNIDDVHKSEPFIRRAKKLGLEVMANYMKSYTASPYEFAEMVKLSEEYGADVVYIVDSAGSMSHCEIEQYYDAIRSVSKIKIGFHGHDNLGLGVANSLFAYNKGFDFIDTSIMGMGRSAGNAATELIVANIIRRYNDNRYDLKKILSCGEKYVRNLWRHGLSSLDVYCGLAEFHTSYMKYIHKISTKYRVNPLDLIMAYSNYDKVNMDEKKLEEIAQTLVKDEELIMTEFGFNEYIGNEQKIGDEK